jgi:hypothetical protein
MRLAIPANSQRVCIPQVSEGDAALVLIATPGRLYVFLGGPGLQGAFSGYSSRSLGAQLPRQSLQRDHALVAMCGE